VNERDYLADRFEANRSHLRAVAYRMLGSVSEAEDAVQEAWLRLSRSDADEIENLHRPRRSRPVRTRGGRRCHSRGFCLVLYV
jgi:DNA-directed RNA polymerase specialized sigma24 family protein